MKATGVFPKCRPGRSGADTAAGQRPGAPPSQRCEDGASGGQAGVVGSGTRPLNRLTMHRPPDSAPHVLLIDSDSASALALAELLMPEARVTHVPTLAGAREILLRQIFSAVVIDPDLPDGDAAELLPALTAIPLLIYSAHQPSWRGPTGVYLPKPWTSPRQLWTTISKLLGISPTCAGD